MFPDANLAQLLYAQLSKFKLADEDIDLLLCLSHLMGRGLKQGGLRQLQEPTFYQAVFVDEVQDFTEQQVFLMVEQANPKYRAVTVVGDVAQKLHHGSSIDPEGLFPGQPVPHVKLIENLRQAEAPGLALFSASFRAVLQGGEAPSPALADKAKQQGASLIRPRIQVYQKQTNSWTHAFLKALDSAKRHQTVAVLFPDSVAAAKVYKRLEVELRERMIEAELFQRRSIWPGMCDISLMRELKGLEFDVVLLAGVDQYDLSNASHINRLYVGITRARQSLSTAIWR